MDIRPLSFRDRDAVMVHLTETVFAMSKTIPANKKIERSPYLPVRGAVRNPVRENGDSLRPRSVSEMQHVRLNYGGSVTVHGVHLKVHGKHFYDFTIHIMEIIETVTSDEMKFRNSDVTFQLVKRTSVPNARNIRETLNDAIIQKYEVILHYFISVFTIFTDVSAVIAHVSNASASREMHSSDGNGCAVGPIC